MRTDQQWKGMERGDNQTAWVLHYRNQMHLLLLFYLPQQDAPFFTAFTLCSSQEPLQMKEKSSEQQQPI